MNEYPCMTAEELRGWEEADRRLHLADQAHVPCEDCTTSFRLSAGCAARISLEPPVRLRGLSPEAAGDSVAREV